MIYFLHSSVSDSEVFGGKIYHTLKYKGYNFYNKSFDLCTFDETDGADRIINCPFLPGDLSFVKDKPIPGYFAKVRYRIFLSIQIHMH